MEYVSGSDSSAYPTFSNSMTRSDSTGSSSDDAGVSGGAAQREINEDSYNSEDRSDSRGSSSDDGRVL